MARPDIDETPHPHEAADCYVKRLSLEKAQAVASTITGEALILAADTTVVDGEQILGKPDTPDDAVAMLKQLRGCAHLGHTGVTLLDTSTGQHSSVVTTTKVMMRNYADEEIAAYVASGDPMGKAGSYAIQNRAFHPVDHLDGCYTNIVGLPMCAVYALLAPYGVRAKTTCSPTNLPCAFG